MRVGILFGEAHAVVADAKAQFAGFSMDLLDIAFAGLSEAVQRGEDAHGSFTVDVPNVSLSGDGKDNFLHDVSTVAASVHPRRCRDRR